MAADDDFIEYLYDLGNRIQNGEIDLDDPESVVIALDGGYTVYDENRDVLLDVTADGEDDVLIVQGANGAYEHAFVMGGKELWGDREIELWDALQGVRASLY